MTDLRKAAEMALEALNIQTPLDKREFELRNSARDALRQALAQPEQEPVAWLDSDGFPWSKEGIECRTTKDIYTPLYTAPPKREWVGLTDEEIEEHFFNNVNTGSLLSFGAGAAYAEAKLKEKNT